MNTEREEARRRNVESLGELLRTGKYRAAAELVSTLARISAEAVRIGTDEAADLCEEVGDLAELLVRGMLPDLPADYAKTWGTEPLSSRLIDLGYRFPVRSSAHQLCLEASLAAARDEGRRLAELTAARAREAARATVAAEMGRRAPDGNGGGS